MGFKAHDFGFTILGFGDSAILAVLLAGPYTPVLAYEPLEEGTVPQPVSASELPGLGGVTVWGPRAYVSLHLALRLLKDQLQGIHFQSPVQPLYLFSKCR